MQSEKTLECGALYRYIMKESSQEGERVIEIERELMNLGGF
jgi:hypothetical protein